MRAGMYVVFTKVVYDGLFPYEPQGEKHIMYIVLYSQMEEVRNVM